MIVASVQMLLSYHTSGSEFARVFRRRAGDFVFTFLRNRVDMVYSNFAYTKARIERGDRFPGWTEHQYRHFRGSLEDHIDTFLSEDASDGAYPPDLSLYDFVGITEEMDRSLMVLNRVLGTRIANCGTINSFPCEKTYRRNELERKLARQLETYRGAREQLLSSAYNGLASIRT